MVLTTTNISFIHWNVKSKTRVVVLTWVAARARATAARARSAMVSKGQSDAISIPRAYIHVDIVCWCTRRDRAGVLKDLRAVRSNKWRRLSSINSTSADWSMYLLCDRLELHRGIDRIPDKKLRRAILSSK